MKSRFALTGTLLILAASMGQALAGATISDKRYWPNEVGPMAYEPSQQDQSQQVDQAAYAQETPFDKADGASQPPKTTKSCTYMGGPKSNLWSCR